MFALDRSSRVLLAGGAFMAFAGAFVTTPFVASGAARVEALPGPRVVPLATPPAVAIVLPRRDPFAGEPAPTHSAPSPGTLARTAVSPFSGPAVPTGMTSAAIPTAIRPLPPNAGAAGVALPFEPAARVTAVITGAHPFALVDEVGTTRVVTLGDRITGEAIVAITSAGIRLAHGATLAVAPPSSAAPVAPTPAVPIPGGRLP